MSDLVVIAWLSIMSIISDTTNIVLENGQGKKPVVAFVKSDNSMIWKSTVNDFVKVFPLHFGQHNEFDSKKYENHIITIAHNGNISENLRLIYSHVLDSLDLIVTPKEIKETIMIRSVNDDILSSDIPDSESSITVIDDTLNCNNIKLPFILNSILPIDKTYSFDYQNSQLVNQRLNCKIARTDKLSTLEMSEYLNNVGINNVIVNNGTTYFVK